MSGYGNHSCNDCTSNSNCPVRNFVQDVSIPNSCSFYWPPGADTAPSEWYWGQLDLIAQQTIEARVKAALERDGVLVIKIGD